MDSYSCGGGIHANSISVYMCCPTHVQNIYTSPVTALSHGFHLFVCVSVFSNNPRCCILILKPWKTSSVQLNIEVQFILPYFECTKQKVLSQKNVN